MNFTSLIRARKVLDLIWKTSWLRGRCWGPRKIGELENHFYDSNITIAFGNELVSISQDPDGSLRVHEFCRVSNETELGKKIKKALKENGLKVKKVKPTG